LSRGAIRAAVFDFDMTLVDSSFAVTECMNLFAAAKGFRKVTREEILSLMGLPIEDELRILWGSFEPDWIDYYRSAFGDRELDMIREFPGARDTLSSLREAGIKVGVATNRGRAKRALSRCGLSNLLDVVIGLEDVKNAKPHPEPVLTAIERIGETPGVAVYVGDAEIDMKTAVAARVPGIGVTTGNFGEERLRAAGASWVCSSLREVPDIIKNMDGGIEIGR
jgi:HAD superfamily hydrolase (TIGR01549 family)